MESRIAVFFSTNREYIPEFILLHIMRFPLRSGSKPVEMCGLEGI
jgi:hypothetical protein